MSIDHKCEIDKEDMEALFKGIGIRSAILDTYIREYHNLVERVPEKYHCSQ